MLFDVVSARSYRRISSRQNAHVAQYRAAAQGELTGQLLLDGPHLVGDAVAAGIAIDHAAVVSTALDRQDVKTLMAELERVGVDIIVATPQVMAAMSPVRSSSAIVALGHRPVSDTARLYGGLASLVIVASDVQDPGNLGAIVRAAEAGSATSVIVAGACADPFGWKALRGSSGSSLRLPIGVAADAAAALTESRRHGCRAIALVPRGGRSLYEIDLTHSTAVLVGGEGPGLDPGLIEQADDRVTIPMHAPVESLNAAVAAAIVVYEALRQRT